MREPDFKHTPVSRIGSLLHWIMGPSSTTVKEGPAKTRCVSLPTDSADPWPQATVSCVRSVYRTQYQRWWVPTVNRTLYTVSIDVPPFMLERYGQAPFAPITYPLLCNHLLEWTTYPHICAIHSFLDELLLNLGGSPTLSKRAWL
jgi:hypothetical protein